MNLLVQHEYYRELLERAPQVRDVERDAVDEADEKIYE
jgi:hypothetical protein